MKITTLTSASGYTKLVGTVEASSGATPFSDTDNLYFSIDVSGDKGDPGDLSGPGSSTDNAVVRWDGTSGTTTQNSSVTIDDSGNVTTAGRIHSTTTGFRFPDNTDQTTAGVIGPASSTDNALVRFDGAGGSAVQNSGWILSDANALTAGGDFDMSGYDLTVDFSTVSAAGEHAEENNANATGTVTIQATDPTVLRRTLTGDVTLHVAGAPTPGYRNPNLLIYSEQFDNAAWSKSNSTISANDIASPRGDTTADKLVENSATSAHLVVQSVTTTVAQTQTLSVFAKADERNWLRVEIDNASATSNFVSAFFNLSTGSVGTIGNGGAGSVTTASIEAYPNGWYRCSISGQPDTSGTAVRARISIGEADNDDTYLGDGSSGLYIWGAQLVEGSDPLVYRSVEAIRQAYGYGWSTELRTTQDGTGGRDLTILPVNQLTYSADLQSTTEAGETRPWTDINTSLSLNAAVGPDGQTTLTKLIEDADGSVSVHTRYQVITGLSPNQTLTVRAVVKDAGDGRTIRIQVNDSAAAGNTIFMDFDPSDGSVDAATPLGNATLVAGTATPLANNCYLLTLTGQPNTSGSDARVEISPLSGGSALYTGDGTSGVFIGNVQVNTGQPVGMIPVATTRAASVVWRGGTAAEIDYASQAAAAESRIIIGVGSDGEILIDDVSVEA
jgi:hypothetical protein